MAGSTIAAHCGRIQNLRVFVEGERGAPLLGLAEMVADTATLERYLEHRAATVGVGTQALACATWLAVLKWVHRGAYDVSSPPECFTAVRRMHNQLSRSFAVDLRGRSDRQSLAAAGRWASWGEITTAAQHIVGTFQSLSRQWQSERRGDDDVAWTPAAPGAGGELRRKLAEAAQEAFVACVYCRLPPGRCLEFSTMVWAKSTGEQPSGGRENLLVIDGAGAASLRLGGFKTSRQMGVQTVDLPRADFDPIIAASLEHRSALLRGQKHAHVFMRPSDGAPLTAGGAWSTFIASVFGRALTATHVRLAGEDDDGWEAPRVTINILRKAFVSSVHGSNTTLEQRESVAAAMRCAPPAGCKALVCVF